ncbi:MAG: DJ-1/PfpI family protein [Candidatus Marinimicrobia bacterium]|nr:DJ-1/PfpI family protein [Candidatus Neomarinimicrobiota bacterium]
MKNQILRALQYFIALFAVSGFAENMHILAIYSQNYGLNANFNRYNMEQYGWEVTTAGVDSLILACAGGPAVRVDKLMSQISDVAVFDAIVIFSSNRFVENPYGDLIGSRATMNLLAKANNLNIPIWATCAGVRVLAAANILNGVSVTGRKEFTNEYTAAGANYLGEDCRPVIDGNIITCMRGQYYNRVVMEAILSVWEKNYGFQAGYEIKEVDFPYTSSAIHIEHADWAVSLGGEFGEGGQTVVETADQSYVAVGYTYSGGSGKADILCAKFNHDGTLMWSKTVGSEGWDYAYSVAEAKNGDLLITGSSTVPGKIRDVIIIRVSSGGDLIWSRIVGGDKVDVGRSVVEVDDGNIFVAGFTESYGSGEDDIFLIKLDSAGDTLFTKTYGGSGPETGDQILALRDGNYLIAGSSGSFTDNRDSYIIKIKSNGEVIWSRATGSITGDSGGYDRINAACETSNGKLLLIGDTNAEAPLNTYFIKADSTGAVEYTDNMGESWYDFGNGITESEVCAITICGTVDYKYGATDGYIRKLDHDGKELMYLTFGGEGKDGFNHILENLEKDFILLGQTRSWGAGATDLLLVKRSGITPKFETTPASGHMPLKVNFKDRSLGNIDVWEWDFENDGVIDSYERNPSHIYTDPGDYSVTMRASRRDNTTSPQTELMENCISVFDGESALGFDLRQTHVSAEANQSLNLTNALTLEAWIYPDGWGESTFWGGMILFKESMSLFISKSHFAFNNESLILKLNHSDGTQSFSFSPLGSIHLGEWSHIAVTYASDSSEVCFYVNGERQETASTVSPSGEIRANADEELVIGSTGSKILMFDGIIDEVRVWNQVRSNSQISTEYKTMLYGSEPGLQAYWPMNEGKGDNLYDFSQQGNNVYIDEAFWVQGKTLEHLAGIEKELSLPVHPVLSQNFPNPFNPRTTLRYELSGEAFVTLAIYDIRGVEINSLVNEQQQAGQYRKVWNGLDQFGNPVSTGIYFCQLKAGTENNTIKMVYTK